MYCWGILFATVKLFFYLYNWSALSIDRCKHVSIYVLCHGFTLSLTLFLSSVCDLNCTGAKLSCCITYHMFEEMSDLKSALHERIRRGGRPSVFLQDQPRQHTLHSAICICKLSILCSDAFCVKSEGASCWQSLGKLYSSHSRKKNSTTLLWPHQHVVARVNCKMNQWNIAAEPAEPAQHSCSRLPVGCS